MPDGNIKYLGMAEQVTGLDGNFFGSWLVAPKEDPSHLTAIGKSIMQTATNLGYRGVAGFDIAICTDGRILVMDLNFRPNGSTAAVLLYKSMAQALQSPVMRNSSWKGAQGFAAFDRTVRQAIEQGIFLPLNVYDPENTYSQGDYPMISGVVAGATREEVNTRMQELDKKGLIDLNA